MSEVRKEYAMDVLGIPADNILFELNAEMMTMNRAINKMSLVIKNAGSEAEVFVYYAGHGFPDKKTKEPYLIPVNVSGTDLEYAIKLKELMTALQNIPPKESWCLSMPVSAGEHVIRGLSLLGE